MKSVRATAPEASPVCPDGMGARLAASLTTRSPKRLGGRDDRVQASQMRLRSVAGPACDIRRGTPLKLHLSVANRGRTYQTLKPSPHCASLHAGYHPHDLPNNEPNREAFP